jgi:glycosyltransferase involved in cell wall biosynthesis
MDLSIVIPLFNEDQSLPELMEWIDRVCMAESITYEVIMVDDGSSDRSWEVIQELGQRFSTVRGIRFRRNYGKSAALNTGFQAVEGDVVITMDADLQDSPDEIHVLYHRIKNEKLDLISGWKKKRYDPISKTIPSKFFNWVTQRMSGIHNLHDFNCGLKAYRKEVVKSIEVYGEMHRYIPVIAKWAGFKRIEEQVVQHRARKYGTTKFGLDRFVKGFLDLLSIFFVGKFRNAPMHFFGTLGSLTFLVGFLAMMGILGQKFYSIYFSDVPARLVAENPWFFISLTAMIIGTQLFLAGFIGELVSRFAVNRNNYQISERLRVDE